jgi:hypothetical protein
MRQMSQNIFCTACAGKNAGDAQRGEFQSRIGEPASANDQVFSHGFKPACLRIVFGVPAARSSFKKIGLEWGTGEGGAVACSGDAQPRAGVSTFATVEMFCNRA